ncbi:MAG: hypothetical protein U0667_01865 [Chloroflexota bacterium]
MSEHEAEIRDRLLAYLLDRRAFDLEAARSHEELGPLLDTEASWEAFDDLNRELQVRYEEFQRRHRTSAAAAAIGTVVYESPPDADPARTEIVSIEVVGSRATVRTLEDVNTFDVLPPFVYQYRLQREDGRWLLVDRWMEGDTKGSRTTWIKGLL